MPGLTKLIVGATMIVAALIVGSATAPLFPHGPQPAEASPSGQGVATLVGPQRIVVRDLPSPPLPGPAQERAQPRHRDPIGPEGRAPTPAANVTDASFAAGAPQPLAAPATSTALFEGLDNNDNDVLTGFIVTPPDPQLAVGPNHVFEMVNIVGRIYTRTGATVQSFSLAAFFGVPAGFRNTDPKILYDALSGRWFASYVSFINNFHPQPDEGRLHLAISQTSDPTGGWNLYSIVYADRIPDYAAIGVTSDKLSASSNVFDIDAGNPTNSGPNSCPPFGFCGDHTIVLEKADVMAGASGPGVCGPSPNVGFCQFPINSARATVRPAQSLSAVSDQYLATQASSSVLTLIRVTGTPEGGNVSEASATNLSMIAQNDPPDSVTSGGSVDSLDSRFLDAMWRDGRLWASASAACVPAGDGTTRSCAHLVEVNTSTTPPTIAQDIMFGAAGQYYAFPAIRTDASADLYVSLTHTNSTIFAEARSTGRLASDPPNTMSGTTLLRAGEVVHTSGRWGDYLGAAVDPSFPECVWLVGEYAKNTPFTSDWDWGTYIAAVSQSSGCDGDNDGLADGSDNCPAITNANQADGDADGVGDVCDNCSAVPNASQANWNSDALGDACQDTDLDSQGLSASQAGGACPTTSPQPRLRDCIELFMGTSPGLACPATPSTNDEPVDAWGPDFNDSQAVDGLDVFLLAQRFGSSTTATPAGKLPYAPRYDFNADSAINGLDVFILTLYFHQTCL